MCVSLSLLHRPVLRSSVFSHRSIAVVPTLDSTMFKGDIDKSDVKQYEKLLTKRKVRAVLKVLLTAWLKHSQMRKRNRQSK